MLLRFLLCLTLTIVSQSTFAQQPCKSYPMNGYTGDCNDLTALFTADGKYVYSSDRMSLKKWDIQTKKVISEITPFPYRLHEITDDPRLIKIKENNYALFDLIDKVIVVPVIVDEKVLRAREEKRLVDRLSQSPNGVKGFERLKKSDPELNVWFGADSTVAVIKAAGKFYKADFSTYKIDQLLPTGSDGKFVPEINTMLTHQAKSGLLMLVDVKTGKQLISGDATSFGESSSFSPSKKYLLLLSKGTTVFIDLLTGQKALLLNFGAVKFKSDGTGFFHYITSSHAYPKEVSNVTEYRYPSLQVIKYMTPAWKYKFDRNNQIHFDPDKRIFFLHYTTVFNKTPMAVYGYDLEKEVIKDSVSFVYNPSANELTAEKKARAEREKIGNAALAKLADMQTPPYVHKLGSRTRTLIAGYTDDGVVAISDLYDQGRTTILWSFPEGRPLASYCDEKTKDKAPANSTMVEGSVGKTILSPTGKTIGFDSYRDGPNHNPSILVYQNGTLKLKAENRALVAVLDDYVLAWTVDIFKKQLNIINISTGTSKEVRTESFDVEGDAHYQKGKIFFPLKDKVGVFDLANPTEVTFYKNADVKKSGYMTHTAVGFGSAFMLNRATGENELIPDYKPTGEYLGSDKLLLRSNILISGYFVDGFHVFDVDAKKTVSNGYLYSGWKKFEDLVYFKNLGKLLVISGSPVYTWPKAKPEDPGASAYTVDVKTGEMTPYVLTESRPALLALEKTWSESSYVYSTPTDAEECEKAARNYPAGHYLYSHNAGPPVIVLGYDCERKTFVVAKREKLFPGTNSSVLVSRPFEQTIEEMRAANYSTPNAQWHICSSCNGYPAGFKTEYYSGWSDWEQKSLNIYLYTRKWETTKSEVLQLCKRCKGEAWVK